MSFFGVSVSASGHLPGNGMQCVSLVRWIDAAGDLLGAVSVGFGQLLGDLAQLDVPVVRIGEAAGDLGGEKEDLPTAVGIRMG